MKKTIAFQGAYGANSNLACSKFYPSYEAVPYQSFFDVFEAVESSRADIGIIPLENSYAGRVSEIHNLLQKSQLYICAEHFFAVSHHLAGVAGSKIEDIKEVFSHPQALMQCQNSLNKLSVIQNEFSNTAKAAQHISFLKNKNMGAICSKEAAIANDLIILKENIQDSGQDNFTIFIVISKNQFDPDKAKSMVLTTLLFTIRNITGSLYKALGGFATNNVNMIKLESYIPGGVSSEAKFFITIEGHPSEKNVALALEELGFFSKNVKLLGVYYADRERIRSLSL